MKLLYVRKRQLGHYGDADADYIPAILSRIGYSVTKIALAGGDESQLVGAGVSIIHASPGYQWFGDLKRTINEVNPDIVHVYLHHGCGLYPFLMSSRGSPKFVLDIRSPLLRAELLGYLLRIKNRLEIHGYDRITAHGIDSARTVIGNGRDIAWIPPGIDLDAIPFSAPESG